MTQMFEKDPQPKPRTPWYSGLRNSFLTGIVVIAPVGLTVWLIWTVIGWVDGFVLPFVPDSYQPEALIKRVLGPETEVNIAQQERSFEKACMIQYPRRGIWAIGFISTVARGEVAERAGDADQLISVFVPTTPNPTSGFLLFFPKSDIIELDMSIEDAAKLVISAGLVYPPSQLGDAPDVVQVKDEKNESAD
jgi:uncharacterized membrane protein